MNPVRGKNLENSADLHKANRASYGMKLRLQRRVGKRPKDQRGLASLVIVATLAIILTFISLGAVRVANRNLSSSLSTQVARSAEFAAEAGINQVIKNASTLATKTTCSSGLTYVTPNLSSDTSITCVLTDANPNSLVYGPLTAGDSKVIKISGYPSGTKFSLLLSWSSHQDPNGSPQNPPVTYAAPPNLTELAWNAPHYPPLLQVTLYPFNFSNSTIDNNPHTRTFYFVPSSSGNAGASINYVAVGGVLNTTVNVQNVDCGAKQHPSGNNGYSYTGYNDLGTYTCNVVITCLNGNSFAGCGALLGNNSQDHYDMRIVPFYKDADVRVEMAGTGGSLMPFASGTQSVVDVTAKSGVARKRLQARISQAPSDPTGVSASGIGNPDWALRSAGTICKRLYIDSTNTVQIPPTNDSTYCRGIATPGLPLSVDLTADNYTVNRGGSVNLSWTIAGTANSCTASNNDSVGNWNGAVSHNTNGNGPVSVGPITSTTVFTIVCTPPSGSPASDTVTISIPAVSLSASINPIHYNTLNTLNWTVTPASYNSAGGFPGGCTPSPSGAWGTSGPFGGGSGTKVSIPAITTPTTYTITCTDSASQPYISSTTVNPFAPTFNFGPTPQTISFGSTATLGWDTVRDADSCSTAGSSPNDPGWTGGPYGTGNGQKVVQPPTAASYTYTFTCTGGGGTTPHTAQVTATTTPPSLSFSANPTQVYTGNNSTLTWTVSNATSCTASNGTGGTSDWINNPSGTSKNAANGTYSQTVGPISGSVGSSHTYRLQCSGPGGNTSTLSATVTIKAAPSLTLSAAINPIDYGVTNALSWNINDNASSCYPGPNGGNWGSPFPNPPTGGPPESAYGHSGTKTSIPAIKVQTGYVITCTGAYGSKSASTVVNVNPPEFQIFPSWTSIMTDGTSVPEQVGGRASDGVHVSGPIKNADSCVPTDNPSNAHPAWQKGPDGNAATNTDWLPGPTTTTLKPDGPSTAPGSWNPGSSEPNGTGLPWFKIILTCTGGGGQHPESAEYVWGVASPPPPPPPPPPSPPPASGPPSISMDLHVIVHQRPDYADNNPGGQYYGDGRCSDGAHYYVVCNATVTATTGDSSYNSQITCTLYSNGSAKDNFSGSSGGVNWTSPTSYGWETLNNNVDSGVEPDLVARCSYSYNGNSDNACRAWHETDPFNVKGQQDVTADDTPC